MIENQNNQKNKNWPIVTLLILMYLVVAMGDNFKGIFVPFFRGEFGVNNTQIGYVMTASLFAYAVFQYAGGSWIEKFGYKKIISLGFILTICAALVLTNCMNFPMLIFGMFLLNIGMAMFNIGVNTLGPVLTVSSTAVLMNIINGAYSAGNTLLQKISGALLETGIPWRTFFLFMMIVSAILFVYLMLVKIPYIPVVTKVQGDKNAVFKDKTIYLYFLTAGFYLASEYGIGNWFVNYMTDAFKMSSDQSANYIALFFGFKTIGLIFGGFIADRLGCFKTILTFGAIASVLSIGGIAMGQSGLIIFSISGLFFSAIFPSIVTTIGGVYKENTSYVTGLILMCAILIAMVISMSVGVFNDMIGTRYGFFIIGICVLLTTIFGNILRLNVRNKGLQL